MKLLDRVLLWVLSVLAIILGLLLILLVLIPSLSWLKASPVRITVGVMTLLSIASALLLLLRCGGPREQEEAALVDDGENGSAYVTLNVLSDMAKRITQDTEGVRSCKSEVKNSEGGVDVELELALNPGIPVAPLASRLQAKLKERIYEMTGIRVNKVSILVEAAAEGKASLPPPIVQLPPAQTESGDKL